MAEYTVAGKAIAVCPNCGKRVEGQVLATKTGMSLIGCGLAVVTLGLSLLIVPIRKRPPDGVAAKYWKCPRCKVVSPA